MANKLGGELAEPLFSLLAQAMAAQPRLTEEMLLTDEGSATVRLLLFQRLSPLLLLRMLPLPAFQVAAVLMCMQSNILCAETICHYHCKGAA